MEKTKQKKQAVSDSELVQVIEIITKKLAYKFKFGYHDIEDMRQQISVFAIEGLANYDHTRPLENFLWTHVRNRLFNFKRDNYQRPDKPCNSCPLVDLMCANNDNNCTKYRDKEDCEIYYIWKKRNDSKKNLMHMNTIDDIKEYIKNPAKQDNESNEILKIIQEELFGPERVIYLKIRHGSKVYKQEYAKLLNKIKEILNEQ